MKKEYDWVDVATIIRDYFRNDREGKFKLPIEIWTIEDEFYNGCITIEKKGKHWTAIYTEDGAEPKQILDVEAPSDFYNVYYPILDAMKVKTAELDPVWSHLEFRAEELPEIRRSII